MGATLARLHGSPFLEVASATVDVQPEEEEEEKAPTRTLCVEGVHCVICRETPRDHHLCCVNGHGGCRECMTRERLRTAACPTCRLPMLDRLIPNPTLNDAIAKTLATSTDTASVAVASRPSSPARRRDPAVERASKLRRVGQLSAAAAALQTGVLNTTDNS